MFALTRASVHGHGRRGRLTLQDVTADQPRGTRVRGTKQPSVVAAALTGLPGFRSAQEIHADLRRQGETVGLTTVYRHLQVLSEQGVIDTIRDPSGEALYRQCGSTGHHHHLTCRICGRSVEVEGRVIEQWAEKVAAEAGFTAVNHTVELFGLCPDHPDAELFEIHGETTVIAAYTDPS